GGSIAEHRLLIPGLRGHVTPVGGFVAVRGVTITILQRPPPASPNRHLAVPPARRRDADRGLRTGGARLSQLPQGSRPVTSAPRACQRLIRQWPPLLSHIRALFAS